MATKPKNGDTARRRASGTSFWNGNPDRDFPRDRARTCADSSGAPECGSPLLPPLSSSTTSSCMWRFHALRPDSGRRFRHQALASLPGRQTQATDPPRGRHEPPRRSIPPSRRPRTRGEAMRLRSRAPPRRGAVRPALPRQIGNAEAGSVHRRAHGTRYPTGPGALLRSHRQRGSRRGRRDPHIRSRHPPGRRIQGTSRQGVPARGKPSGLARDLWREAGSPGDWLRLSPTRLSGQYGAVGS